MAENGLAVRMGRASWKLWWTMFAGPLGWAIDQGVSYMLAQHSCSTGHHYVLHLLSVIGLLIALSGLVTGIAEYRALPEEAREEGPRPVDRAHFQALFGLVFSISFAVVVVAEAVPRWILSACD